MSIRMHFYKLVSLLCIIGEMHHIMNASVLQSRPGDVTEFKYLVCKMRLLGYICQRRFRDCGFFVQELDSFLFNAPKWEISHKCEMYICSDRCKS